MHGLKPLQDCRLYTFVDTAYLRGRSAVDVARALVEGGSDLIQLRAKGLGEVEVLRLAEQLAPVVTKAGVWFVVNDHPRVAAAVGAPLCHLGQEDLAALGCRKVAEVFPDSPRLQFGLSTHAPEQARSAIAAQPAYIAIGPVYPTATKPGRPAVTLRYVQWASEHVQLPWFAIGGITLETLPQVVAAGATRICVVSAILNEGDVARACQCFRDRLTSALA